MDGGQISALLGYLPGNAGFKRIREPVRVSRLIASGHKTAGGVKKRQSPFDPEQTEAVDEAQPSKKRGWKSKTQKTQDAKDTIRGSKRAEPDTPVSVASVPKSKKIKHGWSVVPVSGSAEPVSLMCDGSRKRTASSRYTKDETRIQMCCTSS